MGVVLGVFFIIILLFVVYFIVLKIAHGMIRVSRYIDRKTVGFETDDYDVNKKIATICISLFFIFLAVALIWLFLSDSFIP